MPRNGSGTYSLPQAPFQAGTVISSAAMNSDLSDIASALTGSLPRNGEAGMSGQLKLADGSTASPSISFTTDLTTGFSHGSSTIPVSIGGVSVGSFDTTGWNGTVSGIGSIQVGIVVDFAGSVAPTQWLLCFGQNVSRTTYARLFAVIGTTYGSGDGSTTFGLPDLRGTVTAGLNNMGGVASTNLDATYYLANPNVLGTRGGGKNTSLITSNVPSYTPSGSVSSGVGGNIALPIQGSGSGSPTSAVKQGDNGTGPTTLNVSPTGITVSSSFSGSNNGGSSAPITLVQPSLVMNKMIFAGA